MRHRLRRRNHRQEPADINITAFMNLMVILVPFLLITAVFSRITILELNLPAAGSTVSLQQQPFELEIIVREHSVEIGDRNGGLIERVASTDKGYDIDRISKLLQQVKARFPEKLNATLLLEENIHYDTLVQIMDSVRVARVVQAGSVHLAELFPEIAIGDAPASSVKVASSKGQQP
jgi:biopolymer transport protein ExbD